MPGYFQLALRWTIAQQKSVCISVIQMFERAQKVVDASLRSAEPTGFEALP